MEQATVPFETSIQRPKRGRVLEQEEGPEPSKSTGSPDDLFNDEDDFVPKTKRKRGAAARAAGWSDDQPLIDAIKHNGKVINHAVKKWVEKYEADPKSALIDLLTMLFEACGAKCQLDVEIIDDISVKCVVISLVDLARNGLVEDYYNSKQKELKHFKDNLGAFWDDLVLECQEGPLFDETVFTKCVDYVIALSRTPPRVYRQVTTLVGLQIVTSYISVGKTLIQQRETTQRQLNAEKKKGNDGPRVETLDRRLQVTHNKIIALVKMMGKVFTGLFICRYRDIEPDIRMSCIKALGAWIVNYPSHFLKDSYLKYIGWMLNDKNALVRKTSVLALQSIYEIDDNIPSLSLFTKRFSERMLQMAYDKDIPVAVSAIGLLKLLLRHQLLTDDELGPLYDLLIDEPPMIRRAVGELVYDHLIVQTIKNSQSGSKGSGFFFSSLPWYFECPRTVDNVLNMVLQHNLTDCYALLNPFVKSLTCLPSKMESKCANAPSQLEDLIRKNRMGLSSVFITSSSLIVFWFSTVSALVSTKPGDRSWVFDFEDTVQSWVFYKDRLLQADVNKGLMQINLANEMPNQLQVEVVIPRCQLPDLDRPLYLVDCGGEIILVPFEPGDASQEHFSESFEICKLDLDDETCVRSPNLDNYSIFLGENRTFSVSCHNLSSVPANSIYFCGLCGGATVCYNLTTNCLSFNDFEPFLHLSSLAIKLVEYCMR